jgi:hypothetical protein
MDNSGIVRVARSGDMTFAIPAIVVQNTDSNQTITAAAMSAGVYQRGGMTAGRSDTTDTAVNILAAFPNLDIGETTLFYISVQVAFALTLVAGAGVTLGTKTSVAASSAAMIGVTRTGAATVTITVF